MVDLGQFVGALRQALAIRQIDLADFETQAEPTPPGVTLVRVRFRDAHRGLRERAWQLEYTAAVIGEDAPVLLANYVAQRMLSEMPTITLNCDWGHEWPLWAKGAEFYVADPEDLGLSANLTAALRTFHDFWDEHFVFNEGWDTARSRETAMVESERLTSQLADETNDRFVVENGFRFSFA